jgi:hypothetical protein
MKQEITLIESPKPAVPEVSIHRAGYDSVQINITGPEAELRILGYRVQCLRRQELNKGWDSAYEVEFDKGMSVCF